MTRVLVVDDEPAIRESVAYALRQDGFDPFEADTLGVAESLADRADLIVLDLVLPDGSGVDFLRALRSQSSVPVIVLTSRDAEADRVVGLELGADDYVTKPFSPRELVARVRAVLRRSAKTSERASSSVLRGPDAVELEPDTRRVRVGATALELSKTEFDLLFAFLRAPGRVLSRAQLLGEVRGEQTVVTERTVDVHIKSLRKKLVQAGASEKLIETVRGVGYRVQERNA